MSGMPDKQREKLSQLRDKVEAGAKLSNSDRRELQKLEAVEARWKEYDDADTRADAPSSATGATDSVERFNFIGDLTGVNWSSRLLHMHRKIGGGGSATVFLSRIVKINVPVAVKVIDSGRLVDPMMVKTVAQEVQAMRLVSGCAHCLALYDYADISPTRQAMLIEFMDLDLDKWMCDKGPSEPWWVLGTMLLELCKALAYCAEHEITHRDVKPQNIMLANGADGAMHAKLIDFGIAAIRGEMHASVDSGTVRYLAPEHCRHLGVPSWSKEQCRYVQADHKEQWCPCPENDCWAAGLVGCQLFKQGKLPAWLPREPSADELHEQWARNLAKMDHEELEDKWGNPVVIAAILQAPQPEEYVPKVRCESVRTTICSLLQSDLCNRISAGAAANSLRTAIGDEESGAGKHLLASSDALVPSSLPPFWKEDPGSWAEEVTGNASGGYPA